MFAGYVPGRGKGGVNIYLSRHNRERELSRPLHEKRSATKKEKGSVRTRKEEQQKKADVAEKKKWNGPFKIRN